MKSSIIRPAKIAGLIAATFFLCVNTYGQSSKKKNEIIREAKEAKAAFLKADPDMAEFFNSSYGYVIFPNVGKGGLGVGAAAGTGAVWQQGELIGTARLKQISIGFQAGGQAYREVVFFEADDDLSRLKANKVEFSAQVSAVAVASGVSADAKYSEGVLVFTMAKGGLMYEASVGGQKFTFKRL
ncbi:YSC84-related protein [Spongiimicrobium sp. 3-5]|uniref:lipid-binding SYLF domain-containing protein n=1 Tax=Spongiimicrobium sp. 3-5 TaxID=3332596 RepID=UPI00397FDFD5